MSQERKIYKKKDEPNLKLMLGISRGYQTIHREVGRCFSQYGLSIPQFGILEVLFHKGDMSISEAMNLTLSTGGNMTVIVKNLYQKGLVEKKQNEEDKRSYHLSLTPKGESLLREVFAAHLTYLEEVFQIYNEEEKDMLIRLIKRLDDKRRQG